VDAIVMPALGWVIGGGLPGLAITLGRARNGEPRSVRQFVQALVDF
jgi:hypothetical protein